MAIQNTQTVSRKQGITILDGSPTIPDLADRRLAALLQMNAETARQKWLYRDHRERLEAEMMRKPLSAEQAFSYFGLMLGTLPPAAIFTRFAIETNLLFSGGAWFIGVMLIMNTVSAIVGFISGRSVGKLATTMEKLSWSKMTILAPFIGILWGLMAGGAGGFIFLVFGAAFGAIIGGSVGAVAMPIFVALHRLLKRGDLIELKQFLPLTFGITLSICSFILGR